MRRKDCIPAEAPGASPSQGQILKVLGNTGFALLGCSETSHTYTETDKKLLMWLEKQRVVPSAMRMQEVGRLAPGVFEVTG